jgi:hypothetical protein
MSKPKKQEKRKTVLLAARLDPWTDFALRKYATTHGLSLKTAIGYAVNMLIFGVPKKVKERWLAEFRREKGDYDGN